MRWTHPHGVIGGLPAPVRKRVGHLLLLPCAGGGRPASTLAYDTAGPGHLERRDERSALPPSSRHSGEVRGTAIFPLIFDQNGVDTAERLSTLGPPFPRPCSWPGPMGFLGTVAPRACWWFQLEVSAGAVLGPGGRETRRGLIVVPSSLTRVPGKSPPFHFSEFSWASLFCSTSRYFHL